MDECSLVEWLIENAADGQRRLAATMRQLVSGYDPEALATSPDAGDEYFLDPALFSYFALGEHSATLPQIFFAHHSAAAVRKVAVRSAPDGSIYLPRFGAIRDAPQSAQLVLRFDAKGVTGWGEGSGAGPFAWNRRH